MTDTAVTSTRHPRRDSGFSFVELLAYMAIAALLILAAVPQFQNYRGAARDANTRDDVKNVAQAVEAWSIDHPGETYPFVNVDWDSGNPTHGLDALTDNGLKLSAGTRLIVRDRLQYIGAAADGDALGQAFCVVAYNTAGQRFNGEGGAASFLNYSSRDGGLGHDCRDQPDISTASYAWTGAKNGSTSTRTSGATVETNLVTQTSCGSQWRTRWYGLNAEGYDECVPADATMNRDYQRKTWTKVGGNQDIGTSVTVPVTAGKTYTIAAEARSSWATTEAVFPEWHDADGHGISAPDGWWKGVDMQPGKWTRLSNTQTAPDGAATLSLVWGPYPLTEHLTSKPEIGGTLDLAKPLIVEGSTDPGFFDGDGA